MYIYVPTFTWAVHRQLLVGNKCFITGPVFVTHSSPLVVDADLKSTSLIIQLELTSITVRVIFITGCCACKKELEHYINLPYIL